MGSFITKLSGRSVVNDSQADAGAAAIFAGDIREVWHRHGSYVPKVSIDDAMSILTSQQFSECPISAKVEIATPEGGVEIDVVDKSRKAIVHMQSKTIVSVVGSEWHPMGFEILGELYSELEQAHSGVEISSVLLLGTDDVPCNRAVLVAKLSESFKLDSDNANDTIRPYLMLGIGHTGVHPLYSRNVATRGVCANTENIALSEKKSTVDFSVRHTKNMPNRINLFRKQIASTLAYTAAYANVYSKLHSATLTKEQRESYWKSLLLNVEDAETVQLSQNAQTRFENNFASIKTVYNFASQKERVKPDTVGGAYSAYSEWLEYHATYKGENGTRFRNQFDSLTGGLNARKKIAAFQSAMALAGVSADESLAIV